MTTLGPKALACLEIAAHRGAERQRLCDAACAQYSEKAVYRMFESLASRGYIEFGVSPTFGWLTEKGRAASQL